MATARKTPKLSKQMSEIIPDITASDLEDPALFTSIREQATVLESYYGARNSDFQKYDDAYLLKLEPSIKSELTRSKQQVAVSPDARNVVMGAMRLMIGSDPIWKVAIPDQVDSGQADHIERALARMWSQSGRLNRSRPIHYDIILSALLYGTMHTSISSIQSMADMAPEKNRKRIQKYAEIAPFLYRSIQPRSSYPWFDDWGLSRYYRKVETTVGYIKDNFGLAPAQMANAQASSPATLELFYDLENFFIWSGESILWKEKHGLTEIPIEVTQTDGSALFDKPEDQHQPILYTMIKSGMFDQASLGMSIVFSTAWAMGLNAMFIHKAPTNNSNKTVDINFDEIGGIIELEGDEDFKTWQKGELIDPSIKQAYEMAMQKAQESSMSPQAFGITSGKQGTFSEMNMWNQAGRLPLIGPSQMSGSHIANLALKSLDMIREGSSFKKNGINLEKDAIPSEVDITAKLEVKLAQDRLQLANIASMLKREGLVDDEWIQNNILGITDTTATRERIWGQEASKQMFMEWLKQRLTQKFAPPPAPNADGTIPGANPITPPVGPVMQPNENAVPQVPDQGAMAPPGPGQTAPNVPPAVLQRIMASRGGGPTLEGGLPDVMRGPMPPGPAPLPGRPGGV